MQQCGPEEEAVWGSRVRDSQGSCHPLEEEASVRGTDSMSASHLRQAGFVPLLSHSWNGRNGPGHVESDRERREGEEEKNVCVGVGVGLPLPLLPALSFTDFLLAVAKEREKGGTIKGNTPHVCSFNIFTQFRSGLRLQVTPA